MSGFREVREYRKGIRDLGKSLRTRSKKMKNTRERHAAENVSVSPEASEEVAGMARRSCEPL